MKDVFFFFKGMNYLLSYIKYSILMYIYIHKMYIICL